MAHPVPAHVSRFMRRMPVWLAAGLAFAAGMIAPPAIGQSPAQIQAPIASDIVLGMPEAPVRIIEYASLACPHCAAFNQTVLPRLKARFIAPGDASFVFRDFPTQPAPLSVAAAVLARCAGPDHYYDTLDDLFAAQSVLLATVRNGGDPRPIFLRIGAMNGLAEDEVRTCLEDRARAKAVQADAERADHISGTPTLYVNGVEVEDHSFEGVAAAVEAALAAATGPAG